MLIVPNRKGLFLKISEKSFNTILYTHLSPSLRPHPCHLPFQPPDRKYMTFRQGLTKATSPAKESPSLIWKCLTRTLEADASDIFIVPSYGRLTIFLVFRNCASQPRILDQEKPLLLYACSAPITTLTTHRSSGPRYSNAMLTVSEVGKPAMSMRSH